MNTVDDRGFSPLHYATSLGYHEIVAYLLDHGASVNIQDRFGNTSLNWACHGDHRQVIKLLVEV